MTQEQIPKEGDKVILDYDFTNSSLVYLKKLGKYYSTVSDGDDEWQVMTDRLWAIGQKIFKPTPNDTEPGK